MSMEVYGKGQQNNSYSHLLVHCTQFYRILIMDNAERGSFQPNALCVIEPYSCYCYTSRI